MNWPTAAVLIACVVSVTMFVCVCIMATVMKWIMRDDRPKLPSHSWPKRVAGRRIR